MGSGQQWGTAIGLVAGFWLPGGPQVWAGIGGAIGGAVDPTVLPGPRIGEINKQTASEGIPRPIIFARSQPMPGNVIADSEPRKVYREESTKGGPKVETESVYRTYAIGLCEGPGVVLLEAWKNGQSVYNIEDPSREADNAEFLKYARWFDGSYEQMPSPDLEAVLGVGNVHAHRGLAYIVFADEDVTDNRGAWSQWVFRLGRYPDVIAGQWWAIRPNEPSEEDDRFVWRADAPEDFSASEYRGPPNLQLGASVFGSGIVRTAEGMVILHGSDGQIEIYSSFGETLPAPTIATIYVGAFTLQRIKAYGSLLVAQTTEPGVYYTAVAPYTTWTPRSAPDSSLLLRSMCQLEVGRWVAFFSLGGDLRLCKSDADLPESWEEVDSDVYPSVSSDMVAVGNVAIVFSTNGQVMRSDGGIVWTISALSTVPTSHTGSCAWSEGGIAVFADVNNTHVCVTQSEGISWDNTDVGQTSRSVKFGNGAWVLSGRPTEPTIIVSRDNFDTFSSVAMPGVSESDRNYLVTFVNTSTDYREGFYPLPLIIEELAERVNADDHIDVTLLADYQCRGFTVTNSYPCYSALQELSKVFFFNPANVNGTVKFVPLGADSVATITEDDMIDNEEEIEADSRRGDSVLVPRVLHLNYFDVLGGMNTDKQRSERPEGTRAVGEQSLQTPVILSANEAATIVHKNHAMLVEQQKGELTFALPDNWLRLTESDPVIVQYEGKSLRAVIQQVETDDCEQRYKLIRDRQSIHTMDVEGVPPAVVTPPPSRRRGPTLIEVIDGPLRRDADDRLGISIAVTGIYPAWPGAFVELSLDGGATYIDGSGTNVSAIMGTTTSAMGDHPYAYPDTVNSVQVSINTPDVTLEGTDLIGMLNLKNLALIGDEYIHFADVDEVSEGVWDLSYFLRGRKGTETVGHAIGERFVMLNNAVMFVPLELVYLNQSLTFRATTFGTTTDDATVETLTFAGGTQIERPVSSLTARRDGTDAVIAWYGVGRLGDGFNVAHGFAFAGYRITISDGTVTQTFDQAGTTLTTSLSAFTGPVTIKVYQRNSMTGLGPSVEVTI